MAFRTTLRIVLLFCLFVVGLAGCGGGSSDSDQIGTPNLAPIANAGADRLVQQGSMVALDGSSSSDPDGWIVSYNWEQIRGTGVSLSNPSTVSPSFIAPQAITRQELDFRLTVQDNNGVQSSDTVTITVNVPPVANAGATQTLFLSNPSVETVTLEGIADDSDGDVIAHQWVQTGGPAVNLTGSDTPTTSFTVPATTAAYTFSFTVTDNDGAQATDSVSVYVTRIIFSDTFSDGPFWTNRWTTIDETGNGADWRITELQNAQLRQYNNLESLNFDPETRAYFAGTSYHSGTFAILNHALIANAPSYRFSVDIKPLTNGFVNNRPGNDVGIMFRYVDPNNYYRVSMSARYGYSRFEKRQNGVFQTLAVNAIGYVDNQTMTITAEVNGDTTIVWINGDPIFAVVDNGIWSGTVALFCQDRVAFDNVLITEPPLQPLVVLATPLAYSVALTRDDGNTLPVEAIVLNKPDGGSVAFSLFGQDDDSETVASGTGAAGVYWADFFDLASGEYDVMAVLKDDNGWELAHDINSTVGIGGVYYVTVGDSITNGVGDQFPGNNDSADGRIVGIQGYQAGLSDRLTTTTNRPQIVFNEGIAGDRSLGLLQRIDSILERHPGANRVLLMIGTNDSGASVTPNDFEFQVINTLNKMNSLQVWIAKPMPILNNDGSPNTNRNNFLEGYNGKIDQIITNYPNAYGGPNFYSDFSGRTDLYHDNLHPNDAGYVFMADRWHDVLVQ